MYQISTLILLTGITLNAAKEPAPEVLLDFRPIDKIGEHAKASNGPNDEAAIEVTGGDKRQTITLIVVDKPNVASHQYKVHGRVKFSGVKGDGYLELLNDFGKVGTYFSRSLGDDDGMMGKLTGDGDWREFELPFYADPGMRPARLTLNVVLPGAGQVTIAQPIVLSAIEGYEGEGQWWSERQGGLIGGTVGGCFGLLGGLIGVLMAWTKTRPIVKGLFIVCTGLGVVILITGLVAVALGQPMHVYYPLLLIGVITSTVLGFNYRVLLNRIHDDELRKITAIDSI